MKIIKKVIPIYFGYLRIITTNDFEKAMIKIKAKDKFPGHVLNGYDGLVFPDKTKKGYCRYTILLPKKATHSVIAHEVVHIVNALYIDSGIQLDRHNDESQAYLSGWITRQVYKALKK